jgi:hypothetical protein
MQRDSVTNPGARRALVDAALNAAIPTAVYMLARRAQVGDTAAILLAGIYPAVVALAGVVRRRTLDPVASSCSAWRSASRRSR